MNDMNDSISILVAILVIFCVFRWLLGSTPQQTPVNNRGNITTNDIPRARPRPVTPEMVETVCAMFPNIPPAAVQYDLQKTGSVEVTCDNILQNGGLPLLQEAVNKGLVPQDPPKIWETTPEKRQELLQQKKDAMVLQARVRYLEQQRKKELETKTCSFENPSLTDLTQLTNNNSLKTPIIQSFSEDDQDLHPELRRQQILQATERRWNKE
ncbi:17633_t:CDS:2, partial [Acaulospora colombiana]